MALSRGKGKSFAFAIILKNFKFIYRPPTGRQNKSSSNLQKKHKFMTKVGHTVPVGIFVYC